MSYTIGATTSSTSVETEDLVSKDAIVTDLETDADDKVLSASQGVILKEMIENNSAVPLVDFQIIEADGVNSDGTIVENEVLVIVPPEDGGYENTLAITRWGTIRVLTNYPESVRDGIEVNAVGGDSDRFQLLSRHGDTLINILDIGDDGFINTKAGTIKPSYKPIMTVGLSDTVAYVDEDVYHQVEFDKIFVEENNDPPLYEGAVKPITLNSDGSISLGETGRYNITINVCLGNLTDNYEVRLLQNGEVLYNYYGSTERNYGNDVIGLRMVYLTHSAPITVEVLSRSDESWQLRGDSDLARSFSMTIEKEEFKW